METKNKESIWGENQLGLFSKGRTSTESIGKECAFGVVNTASPVMIYLFNHPGSELFIANNLTQLLGKHGINLDTQVCSNSSQERLGTLSDVIQSYEKLLADKAVIESKGFVVEFCTDNGHWEVHMDPANEPECDSHALQNCRYASLGMLVTESQALLTQ